MEAGRHIANQVGRITTTGVVSEFAIPTYDHSGPSITPGRDGNVWFTHPNPGKIGKVDLSGFIPSVAFGSSSYSAWESAGQTTIQVTRSGDASGTVGVQYAISNGSALFGRDYQAVLSGTLTFNPGETVKTITIQLNDNAAIDGSRTLHVSLSNVTGGRLGTPSATTMTILDNDYVPPPPPPPLPPPPPPPPVPAPQPPRRRQPCKRRGRGPRRRPCVRRKEVILEMSAVS
jgi:hypothetical protein